MEKLTRIEIEDLIASRSELNFQNADLTNIELDGANLKGTFLEFEVS